MALGGGSKLPELLKYIAELLDKGYSRTAIFTESFNYIKELLNSSDPYIYTKRKLSEIGRRVAKIVRKHLANSNWGLHEAIRISAAANIIDTSVIGYEPKDLDKAIWDKPAIDEYTGIPKDKKVVIVLDNAGEAEIDLILAETFIRNGYNTSIAVRKEAYEIDVTYSDIIDQATNLGIEIIATPNNTPPIAYLTEGFAIVKGIANLESYIELETVKSLHLFRAKCEVLAKIFDVPKNSPLILFGDKSRKLLKNLFSF